MSQIQIEILKQGTLSKKVLSCSFFTAEDKYRDFVKYQAHLKEFLEQQKQINQCEVRIYTDDSGKEFALEVSKNYENVSVYHYDCPIFKNGKWHVGMFGALCRLLPLFENLDVVWVSDIDIPLRFLNPAILEDLNDKTPVYIDTRVCSSTRKFGRRFPIILHKFISKLKFPSILLMRFLTDLHEGKEQYAIDYMNEVNKSKPQSKVPYGIDEYFMNTRMYEYLKINGIQCLIGKDYLNRKVMQENTSDEYKYVLRNYFLTHDKKMLPKIKNILRDELPSLIQKYPCCKETLDNLDNFEISTQVFYKTLI